MEAPTPAYHRGSFQHVWACPLCHRDPIDPRVANCGHTFCLVCLKDVQVTAELFKFYPPRCNLCHADISDQQSVASSAHCLLPPPTPIDSNSNSNANGPGYQGTIVGEALAALHQRASDPRNHYASDLQSMYQHASYESHAQQLPHYDDQQDFQDSRIPSSDLIVNTIECSPGGRFNMVSENKPPVSQFSPRSPFLQSVVVKSGQFT